MMFFFRRHRHRRNKSKTLKAIKSKNQTNNKYDTSKININSKKVGKRKVNSISAITIYLSNCGLVSYLHSTSGGMRDIQSTNQLVHRVDLFLNFNYIMIYKYRCIPLSFNVEMFFSRVIKNHYNMIPQFIEYMEGRKSLSVSSQLNYLYDIQRSVHWFCLFRRNNSVSTRVSTVPYTRWIDCIKNIKKPLQHRLSLEKSRGSSLQEKIYNNEYPEGGLQQLQDCIKEEMEFIESFNYSDISYIDEATYRRFMEILYSACYAFGVQGRIAGIIY